VDSKTGEFLELDIFIPSLQLAFEYQERHHYTTTEIVQTPLEETQARDKLKKELARAKGITLIEVPCWWDGKQDR